MELNSKPIIENSQTIIEKNFTTTKELESLFVAMNSICDIKQQIENIIQTNKQKLLQNLQDTKDIGNYCLQIQEIIDSFGEQIKEIFEYDHLYQNLQFVKSKLQQRKDNLIAKLTQTPLDKISDMEDLVTYVYNNIQIAKGARILRVEAKAELKDILYSQKNKGLWTRLINSLRSENIKTVGDLIDFWDSQEKNGLLPYSFPKIRKLGTNTIRFLGIVMRDIIFLKHTQEDAIKIQQLLKYKKKA